MKNKVNIDITCITIILIPAVFICLCALQARFYPYSKDPREVDLPGSWGFILVTLVFTVFAVLVQIGLTKRKKWAWISNIVIFGLFLFTVVLLPIGAIGLWSLVSETSLGEFGMGRKELNIK